MVASIFKNFDPNYVGCAGENIIYGIKADEMPVKQIFDLLKDGFHSCAARKGKDEWAQKVLLNNHEFCRLAKRMSVLARSGHINNGLGVWTGHESPRFVEFDHNTFDNWASHGLEMYGEQGITSVQLRGICALWLIDEALSMVKDQGWCAQVVEILLTATILLKEANIYEDEYLAEHFIADELDYKDQEAKSAADEIQSKRLSARHAATNAMKKEACRLYAANKGRISRRQAAKSIIPLVQKFGWENYRKQLSDDRAEITIYEWLSAYDKKSS